MPSVCFYFQVHQPTRLKFRCWEWANGSEDYFDNEANCQIMRKVTEKCYLPANETMLQLIKKHKGEFKISYAISGVCLEQMEKYAPEVIESFRKLVDTGCVELVGETYYHSLAACYDEQEFKEQVQAHAEITKRLFNYEPKVFRNTELIYDDNIGRIVSEMGYKAILTEGPDDIMEWRNPNLVYTVPGQQTRILTKNYKLSDDIAFRFSNREWAEYPLTAEKFSWWLHEQAGEQQVVNLFMDYETFGEHQWEDTGIFQFLEHLPEKIFTNCWWNFKTPSEVIETYEPKAELAFNRTTSWADMERDLTAWRGNSMQQKSLERAFAMGEKLRASGNEELIHTWRKLLTSDHFYYMCTKWFSDGDVHAYFSPFENPYYAFVAFANVISHFEEEMLKGQKDIASRQESKQESQQQVKMLEPEEVTIVLEVESLAKIDLPANLPENGSPENVVSHAAFKNFFGAKRTKN